MTKRVSQKMQKLNEVVGKRFLPRKTFSDDGNKSPYIWFWTPSACSCSRSYLIGTTTRSWPK